MEWKSFEHIQIVRSTVDSRAVVLNLFLHRWRHDTHFENYKLVTHLEYPNSEQMPNYMYHKLKVKVWNNLATHPKKLATRKCVEKPRLRNTAVEHITLQNSSMQMGL